MATPEEQITPADAAIVTTGTGRKGPEEHDLPESLKYDMDLCLEILRNVLGEYNPELLSTFDTVRHYAVEASAEHFAELKDPNPDQDGLKEAVNVIDNMTLHDAQLLARAFATYFHLANLSEENYRVSVLHERENNVPVDQAVDPINELTVAYHQLINETGPAKAKELLNQLEFHPVFTAHPTEARRKAVEGKIRRVSELLEEYKRLGGSDKKECLRRLYNEIDALFRTSPIALKKPTPVEEADTILDIFDNTLFNTIPKVYRRFDDWVLGDKAGLVEPACPAFFHPGSWIGSDRDGNPNVTAKVSRAVARKFSDHVIAALEEATRTVGRNLTMEAETTPPSAELKSLWSHQKEMSERLTDKAALISTKEMHRAVMLVGKAGSSNEGCERTTIDALSLYLDEAEAQVRADKENGTNSYLFRGYNKCRRALLLARAGTDSSMETRTRLVLLKYGLNCPQVNYPIFVGNNTRPIYLDLAYPEFKICIEYEGSHHAGQWLNDARRRQMIEDAGWKYIQVTKLDIGDEAGEEALARRVAERIQEVTGKTVQLTMRQTTQQISDVRKLRRIPLYKRLKFEPLLPIIPTTQE
jgi:hypothetical protein